MRLNEDVLRRGLVSPEKNAGLGFDPVFYNYVIYFVSEANLVYAWRRGSSLP
jgi:hypothetical protein